MLPFIEIAEDRIGFFIYASAKYRGSGRWARTWLSDSAILHEENFNPNDRLIDVFGIEMVQIPPGAYSLGESDTAASWKKFSFSPSHGNGRAAGLRKVDPEKENLPVGKQAGSLYYDARNRQKSQGDQKGTIPAAFPKGFQAFYIMKYETSQGQYTEFLNSISSGAT